MANYAHHQAGVAPMAGIQMRLANCVFAAEGMLGEILVDHDPPVHYDAKSRSLKKRRGAAECHTFK